MLLKSFKNNFYSLTTFVLVISLVVFGGGFIVSLISPVFAFPGSANVWNIERISGSNLLNFYYNSSGSTIFQLNPTSGASGARSIVDLDSTTYLLDPNGTSNLNKLSLTTNGIGPVITMPVFQGNITSYTGFNSTDLLYMSDGVPYYWGIGREPGDWVSPFPDLVMSNHTGIRLAAHSGYGGVSIYDQLNLDANAWSSAGTEIARFRAIGNGGWGGPSYIINTKLGIGTTTPGKKLDVKGVGTDGIRIQRAAAAQDTELTFSNEVATDNWFFHANGSSPEQMFIYPSASSQNLILQANEAGTALGNVGIGTTSPQALLHVQGSTPRAMFFDSDAAISAANPAWGVRGHNDGTFRIQSTTDYAAYADRLVINNTGNVGIGTATPGQNLDVSGAANANIISRVISSGTGGSYFLLSSAGGQNELWTPSSGDLYMNSGGVAAGVFQMVHAGAVASTMILKTGNVGVGTDPQTKFHIGGLGSGNDGLAFYAASDDHLGIQTVLNNQGYSSGYGADANILVLQQYAGRVGIGTTAPSAKFQVGGGTAGTARIDGAIGINGYNPGACQAGFGLCVGGSSGGQSIWTNTSDARLKKNITTIPNALEKVMALRGVYFDFKDMDGVYKTLPKGRQVGFIAQEVEPILPEVVITGTDGMKMMGYGSITALLSEAIKEQQKQIETEKARNDQQQLEIEQLKLEIEQLKNK